MVQKSPQKITFEEFCDLLQPGYRIFITSGPAVPARTVRDIIEAGEHGNLIDIEIIQLVHNGELFPRAHSDKDRYRLKTFSFGEGIHRAVQGGNVDFIPSHLSEIAHLFLTGSIGIDVALIQTSPPDRNGFLNLGIVADVANIVLKKAKCIIAEVNPNVPVTCGATSVHIGQLDYIIESDEPLLEYRPEPADEVDYIIGWNISNLIDNDSILSLHLGPIFDKTAEHLKTQRGLRIFSHVISDWAMGLIESGVVALDRGDYQIAPVTTSSCYGSRRIYDYVDHNSFFEFLPLFQSTHQKRIMQLHKLVSVMDVRKIDISGDTVIISPEDVLLSGFDSKLNFAIASALSRGGKPIVALRSTDPSGNSNIVISHREDNALRRSLQGVARYVVTEFGVANLFGKSIRERTIALIDIAHPRHREELLREAKEAGYIYPDQIYVSHHAANYPYSMETVKSFDRDRLEVEFRPIKVSDEDLMRRLFYSSSAKSKYLRYFMPLRNMTHEQMQPYVNIDYQSTLSIVALVHQEGAERIIAEARYAVCDGHPDLYEMAFLVDEEFQGKGIGSFLFNLLLIAARDRGVRRLRGSVLKENRKMSSVFQSAAIQPEVGKEDDVCLYYFDLESSMEQTGRSASA